MLVRTAILVASVVAASHSLAAESAISACQYSEIQAGKTVRFDKCATIAHQQGQAATQMAVPPSGFGAVAGDEVRLPSHGRALKKIAVYASVQNHDAVAIESSRVQKFGATHEEIEDATIWTKLHDGSVTPAPADDAGSVWKVVY